MCRIATIISENKLTLPSRMEAMTNAMQHGGPDDAGHYIDDVLPVAMGHRRLSIIDLSSSGHQPMQNADGSIVISFNGEIYNYQSLQLELKAKGYIFRSTSDTEVLIHGYAAWGIDLLPKLQGMFAFILLDKNKQQIIAVRDHAGIKPLYFAKKGGDFYFTSEVRGLLAVDPGWPQYQQWPIWLLTFGFLPEPFTTLQNVQHLPKGSYMVYDLPTFNYHINSYHQQQYHITITDTAEAIKQTRTTMMAAVQRHLVADVPVGLFLSGGIDSSILTIVAQQLQQKQLQTLSIYFDDEQYSEKYYQDLVITKTGVQHQSFKVSSTEFTDSLEDIYQAMDQPSTDGINTYFITKYAKQKGFKVVLSGLGADELFGGYPSFFRGNQVKRIQQIGAATGIINAFAKGYPLKKIGFASKQRWYNDYLLNRGLFTPDDTARILGVDTKSVETELNKLPVPNGLQHLHSTNRVSQLEAGVYMQNQLLRDSDIYSMWHSVELRVPFLDKEVMDLAGKIDPAIKFQPKPKKFLLVEAFKQELPEAVWNRTKQGFVFPLEKWFRTIPAFSNHWYVPTTWQERFQKEQINYSRIWGIFLSRTFGSSWKLNLYNSPRTATTAFMYLSAFANTGGIEKVNRAIVKTLADSFTHTTVSQVFSVYDRYTDARYFPAYLFKGFNANRIKFMWHLLFCDIPWTHVIAGHINLAPAIRLLKWRKPGLQITVITHGIEVWQPLHGMKHQLLMQANQIIAVSEYTRQQLITKNNIEASKIKVQSNCLDPYYVPYMSTQKPGYLKKRYQITKGTKVVITVARLSSYEKNKGCDLVLEAMVQVQQQHPNVLYLLCGKADAAEQQRIQKLIDQLNLHNTVLLTGFIADDELVDHYALADVFAMPSKKEGFGIVFIEAAACGTAVIAGNSDGSAEALLQGKIGTLIDADDVHALANAINEKVASTYDKNQLRQTVQDAYGFEKYKARMRELVGGGKVEEVEEVEKVEEV